MVKSVSLATGRSFPTVKAALDHFSEVLKKQPDKAPFAGADEDDIDAAYLAYCAKTNWTLESPPASYYPTRGRSEEHTSELQSLMRISYAVFCLKKKTNCTNRVNT